MTEMHLVFHHGALAQPLAVGTILCELEPAYTALSMHMRAFEAFGDAPQHVLNNRLKTAVTDWIPSVNL